MFVTVFVPGRIELLGNHTDYNGGRVLVVPTRRAVRVFLRAVSTPEIVLESSAFPKIVRRTGRAMGRARGASAWANYALGALRLGLACWPRSGGLHMKIDGDLPAGAGLSSSAALSVAILRALARMSRRRPSVAQLSNLARRVENDFVGVPVGPLDPLSCAAGRQGWITRLDFAAEPSLQTAPMPRGWKILLFGTGTGRELRASAYARRRAECAAAAKSLGVATLGSLTPKEFARRSRRLPTRLRKRARHVVEESARVDRAFALLHRGGEAAQIGLLLNASQESSRRNFENSHPVIDAVVARLRSIRGVAGARLTGGGFGGAVIAWVREAAVERTVAEMARPGKGSAGILDKI